MGSMSIAHWLIVLAIIMLVFGTKKIGSIGSDLGKAIKGFNDGVKGADSEQAASDGQARQEKPAQANGNNG